MLNLLVAADISNLYFCAKEQFKNRVDYTYLLKKIVRRDNMIRALAYGTETNGDTGFKNHLANSGWDVRFREAKVFKDGQRKANQDLEMACDVIRHMHDVHKIALCTGDGDFSALIRFLKERGKIVCVYGINISHELQIADLCVELNERFLECHNPRPGVVCQQPQR